MRSSTSRVLITPFPVPRRVFAVAGMFLTLAFLGVSGFWASPVVAQGAPPESPQIIAIDGVTIQPSSGVHDFTGLPLTADGWTDLHAMINSDGYTDARIVYVSNSGNDSSGQVYSRNSSAIGGQPLNPTGSIAPYATLAAAYNQLRNGYPDVMLLRRGDSWTSSLTATKGGRNNSSRMIFAAYGPESVARPVVRELSTDNGATHVVLSSIHNAFTGTNTVMFRGENVLVEDYLWESPANSESQVIATLLNYGRGTIRRSAASWTVFFTGVWGSQPANSQSRFEEVTISRSRAGSGLSNVYFAERAEGIQSIGNQSLMTGNAGFRQRGGGIVRENLTMGTQPGLSFGGGFDVQGRAVVERNVGMHSPGPHDLVAMNASVVDGNIWTAVTSGSGFPVLRFPGEYDSPSGAIHGGVFGYTIISNNILFSTESPSSIAWSGANGSLFSYFNAGASYTFRGNAIIKANGGQVLSVPTDTRISFQDQRYFSTASTGNWFANRSYDQMVPTTGAATSPSQFSNPNRNAVTYMQSIGAQPSSISQALEWYSDGVPGNPSLAGALSNRRGAWDTRFTAKAVINHIRAGFDLERL